MLYTSLSPPLAASINVLSSRLTCGLLVFLLHPIASESPSCTSVNIHPQAFVGGAKSGFLMHTIHSRFIKADLAGRGEGRSSSPHTFRPLWHLSLWSIRADIKKVEASHLEKQYARHGLARVCLSKGSAKREAR